MTEATRINGEPLPTEVLDWICSTLINDYGFIPRQSRKYNTAFCLHGIVKDLLLEAAAMPRFKKYAALCASKAHRPLPGKTVLARYWAPTIDSKKRQRVHTHIYAVYNRYGFFRSFEVNIRRKECQVKRHVPGPVENAISYRDRVLDALNGPNPEDSLKVPLLSQ